MGPSREKLLLLRVLSELNKATAVIVRCKFSVNKELANIANREKIEAKKSRGEEKGRLLIKVRSMRKAGRTNKSIASELNLHPSTVSKMCRFAKRRATTKPELPRKKVNAAAGR